VYVIVVDHSQLSSNSYNISVLAHCIGIMSTFPNNELLQLHKRRDRIHRIKIDNITLTIGTRQNERGRVHYRENST
jgi:hypothetical protein